MAFSTWTELKQKLLDDLASGQWSKTSSYSVSTGNGSRTFTYRSFDDFRKILDFVSDQAVLEKGIPAFYGRVVAGNGGRGEYPGQSGPPAAWRGCWPAIPAIRPRNTAAWTNGNSSAARSII